MSDKDFLTIAEACQRLGVSRMTLSRRMHDGRLPAFARPIRNKELFVRASDVDALLIPQPASLAVGPDAPTKRRRLRAQ